MTSHRLWSAPALPKWRGWAGELILDSGFSGQGLQMYRAWREPWGRDLWCQGGVQACQKDDGALRGLGVYTEDEIAGQWPLEAGEQMWRK